jgi:competence protein ComGC
VVCDDTAKSNDANKMIINLISVILLLIIPDMLGLNPEINIGQNTINKILMKPSTIYNA